MKDNFRATLLQELENYRVHLTKQKISIGVINGHLRVANLFINHIYNFTNYTRFEDISIAHATTKFLAHVKWEGLSDWIPKEVKIKLRGFFEFLETRGYKNEGILLSLKK